jgi:glucose dehydrogenase
MPISVTCACGRKLKAPDAAAGRMAKCPECGAAVPVPDPARMVHVLTAPAGRAANGVGVASLVLGVLALGVCWIPFLGLLAWPLAAFALLLGVVGLLVAAFDGRSGFGSPVGGIVSGVVAVVLSFAVTGLTSQAVSRASAGRAKAARAARAAKAPAKAPPRPIPDAFAGAR